VHLAAASRPAPEMLAREGVAHLMEPFQPDQRGVKQRQIGGVEDVRSLPAQIGAVSAATMIIILPMVLLYFGLRTFLIKGMVVGAIKE